MGLHRTIFGGLTPAQAASFVTATSGYGAAAKQQRRPVHTAITTWQTGHGWTVNGSGGTVWNLNDTTDFVVGSQCISGTTLGDGVIGQACRKAANPSVDLTNSDLLLWVKVTNLEHLKRIQFVAGSGSFANFFSASVYDGSLAPLLTRHIREGEWFPFRFNLADIPVVTGSPVRTTLTDFQVTLSDDNTGNPVKVQLGGLFFYPRTPTLLGGAVSLTFDDGYRSFLTFAAPQMALYGWAGTLYPIIDQIGVPNFLTLADVQELQNVYGWEVGIHAATLAAHSLGFPSLTSAVLQSEMQQSKAWAVDNGLYGAEHMAWPLGFHSLAAEQIVARTCATGRTLSENPQDVVQPGAPLRLRCIGAGNNLAKLQAEVTKAAANGSWLILCLHDLLVSGSSSMLRADFTTLLASIKTAGIPVLPVGHVWRAGL